MRLVFEVFCDRQRIETVSLSFSDPNLWPDMAVGKDAMGMKVHGQRQVLLGIWEFDRSAATVLRCVHTSVCVDQFRREQRQYENR